MLPPCPPCALSSLHCVHAHATYQSPHTHTPHTHTHTHTHTQPHTAIAVATIPLKGSIHVLIHTPTPTHDVQTHAHAHAHAHAQFRVQGLGFSPGAGSHPVATLSHYAPYHTIVMTRRASDSVSAQRGPGTGQGRCGGTEGGAWCVGKERRAWGQEPPEHKRAIV
jgi:hypothetical protein